MIRHCLAARSWITFLALALGMGSPALAQAHKGDGTTGEIVVREMGEAGDFPLAGSGDRGAVAPVWVDAGDFPVVRHAARLLTEDVERVTGRKPTLTSDKGALKGPVVLVGTIGSSPLIDQLAEQGKLDLAAIGGKWESFVIQTVSRPFDGVEQALVIAGSDRRGTAFGVFELSERIGVSPWYWWADVTPDRREGLYVQAGAHEWGPPSVKYRGIFINDEDWGLEPWSRLTFDPELGDIGPKTYEKVFELLLRLKGNYLWPGMHNCTIEFGSVPGNIEKADEWAIVMGAAHCEPLNRNNVWWHKDGKGEWRYDTNRRNMIAYWEEWAQKRGTYEAVWTVGMRGIHDSGMKGPETIEGQVDLLEQAIADQRELLKKHVHGNVEQVPQVFTPYKEALTHYQAGLELPEDITILWAEDNYGYIRQLSDPQEQQRSGGSGVYYHISYLGWPRPYLWLNTTPPALMWSEMTKAYEQGAERIWIVNVGDIKPGEIGTEFWMQLAWDVDRWGPGDAQNRFLLAWATREFGDDHAAAIAGVMDDYYELGFQRKPELMDSNIFHAAHYSEWDRRINASRDLRQRADEIYAQIPQHKRDAFYQLVSYPVRILSLVDEVFYASDLSRLHAMQGRSGAQALAEQSAAAVEEIEAETRYYNEELAGGKWRHMMTVKGIGGRWNVQWPAGGSVKPINGAGMGIVVQGSGRPLISDQLKGRLEADVIELKAAEAALERPMERRATEDVEYLVVPNREPAKTGNTLTAGEGAEATFNFDVPRAGQYNLYALINAPTIEDDSWFVKMDEGGWQAWNDNATRGWEWRKQGSYQLAAGRHILKVANREDGAMLSAIRLTPREGALSLDETFADAGPANVLPTFDRRLARRQGVIDVYNLGREPFEFSVSADVPWVKLSTHGARVEDEQQVTVEVDWSKLPAGEPTAKGVVTVRGPDTEHSIQVTAIATPPQEASESARFVEMDGYLSIEAEHFSRRRSGADGAQWQIVGDLGRTGDAISVLPTMMPSRSEVAEIIKSAPSVEFDVSVHSTPREIRAVVYCLPTHRLYDGRGLRYAIALDDEAPQIVDFYESGGHGGEQSARWRENVARNAAINITSHKPPAGSGRHTLRIWAVDPGVVIDKIVLDTGGLKESYLGPPETRIEAQR